MQKNVFLSDFCFDLVVLLLIHLLRTFVTTTFLFEYSSPIGTDRPNYTNQPPPYTTNCIRSIFIMERLIVDHIILSIQNPRPKSSSLSPLDLRRWTSVYYLSRQSRFQSLSPPVFPRTLQPTLHSCFAAALPPLLPE